MPSHRRQRLMARLIRNLNASPPSTDRPSMFHSKIRHNPLRSIRSVLSLICPSNEVLRAPFFGPSIRPSSAVRWIAPTSFEYARAARLDSLLHPHKSPSSQLQNGQASTTFSKHVSNTRKMWPARQQRYILSMIFGMAESGIAKGLLNTGEFGAVLFPSMVQGTTVYTLIPTGIRLV